MQKLVEDAVRKRQRNTAPFIVVGQKDGLGKRLLFRVEQFSIERPTGTGDLPEFSALSRRRVRG